MAFYVGQKVICVRDDIAAPRKYPEAYPKRGCVYTIRGIKEGGKRGVAVWLEEIHNQKFSYDDGYREVSFYHWRFRPVIERKTSIEIFQRMLTPSKVDA